VAPELLDDEAAEDLVGKLWESRLDKARSESGTRRTERSNESDSGSG